MKKKILDDKTSITCCQSDSTPYKPTANTSQPASQPAVAINQFLAKKKLRFSLLSAKNMNRNNKENLSFSFPIFIYF